MYFDANNLYGWAMKHKLPYGDFKWQTPETYQDLKKDKEFLKNYSFIVDVDLKYANDSKKKTHKMPLAPEKKIPQLENLNKWQKDYVNGKQTKTPKLICDLYDKKIYVIHQELLNYYVSLGMEIVKVNRVISFREEKW